MYLAQILQPDITLLGLRIQEPVIVLTNFMISLVCFYAYNKLPNSQSRSTNMMKYYFLMFGISTVVGGIFGHGFTYAFDSAWKIAGWSLAIISVFFLEMAAVEYSKAYLNFKTSRIIIALNIAAMLILMGLTAFYKNFKFVEMHSIYGIMLVFLPLHLLIHKKSKSTGSKFMIYSVVVLISTIFVFRIPVVIHAYFNHIDLAHVIMCATIILMLKGAMLYYNEELRPAS